MKTFEILCFLALGGLVLSAPNLEDELYIRSPTKCTSVTAIISVLSQHGPAATSFCSSYISIPLGTATSKIVHPNSLFDEERKMLILVGRDVGGKDFDSDTNKNNNPKNVSYSRLESCIIFLVRRKN